MVLVLSVIRCPDQAVPEQRRVPGGEYVMGRGAECDWPLRDPERVLSKRHCAVEYLSGAWQVRDLSTNGTFLNSGAEPVGRDQVRVLRDGDRLRLGAYEIECHVEEEAGYGEGRWQSAAAVPDPMAPAPAPVSDIFSAPLPGLSPGDSNPSGHSPLLPSDFDPFAADDHGPVMPDHRPSTNDVFTPPRATMPDLLPNDWNAPTAPRPSAPSADPFASLPDPFADAPPGAAARPAAPFSPPPVAPTSLGDPFADLAPQAAPLPAAPQPDPFAINPALPPLASPPLGDPFADLSPQGLPPHPVVAQPDPFAAPPASSSLGDPFADLAPQAAPLHPTAAPDPFAAPPASPFPDHGFAEQVPPPLPQPDPFAEPHLPASRAPEPVAFAEPPPAPAAIPADPFLEAPPPASTVTVAVNAPSPAVAAAPGGDLHAAAALLFQAAGLPPPPPNLDPAAALSTAGLVLRAAVAGMRALLIARADVKREFRIEQTMLRAAGNNPVKFAADDDAAVQALLTAPRHAAGAIRETVQDLTAHQLATLAATQAAAKALLTRLSPAPLEGEITSGGLLPGGREKKLWEAYKRLHHQVTDQFEDDFDSAFGKAFARAYEEAARGGS
ncbi:type VI secretion system-associated FHA domain protein TagH [Roseococcus pinisoli]|uniref:Type VI secretion system-associated FHA domain protein TagH n=1 Tax=Roseococcus pinisoli TaxID=2835040 RepID=A0ABS5QIB8_9PROT|nr:type VI secretion system-associated FHA domain protein TagH [Roseococcus pinisoli]MBS7813317.1 type VI secretion system-associated FHA domain protein TagH [Roseococcus pinisoli]